MEAEIQCVPRGRGTHYQPASTYVCRIHLDTYVNRFRYRTIDFVPTDIPHQPPGDAFSWHLQGEGAAAIALRYAFSVAYQMHLVCPVMTNIKAAQDEPDRQEATAVAMHGESYDTNKDFLVCSTRVRNQTAHKIHPVSSDYTTLSWLDWERRRDLWEANPRVDRTVRAKPKKMIVT